MTAPTKKKTVKKKAVKKKVVKKSPAIKKNGKPHKPHNRTGEKRGTYKSAAPKRKRDKNGGNKGNKVIVLTESQIGELTKTAAVGCTYQEMANHIGIDRDTLRARREDQSGVQEAINKGKALGTAKAKNTLYSVAMASPSKFKQVNLNALIYFLNNNSEFSSQLEVSEGTAIPKDVDIDDDEAVKSYLEMIKKPR